MTLGIDDLLKQVTLEDRVYRHRCVEAWSMVVPWVGYSLSALLKQAEPQGSARFVRFETAADPETMPGLRSRILNWPYVEALPGIGAWTAHYVAMRALRWPDR